MGREVVKLVTPGTLLEPLDQQANYLLCIATGPVQTLGLAWVDISTADFQVLSESGSYSACGVSNLCVVQLTSSEVEDLDEDLERICPSEVKPFVATKLLPAFELILFSSFPLLLFFSCRFFYQRV